VEFSLVIPLFLTIFMAIVEFAFMFSSFVSVGFASHDAAQLAATYGDTPGADTLVLQRVDNDIMLPANAAQLKTVDIYLVDTSTPNATPVSGKETIYTYDGGSHPFTTPDGTTVYLPFVQSQNGYPYSDRCNVNGGIGCTGGKTTVDTIAVKLAYQYTWVTPFPRLIGGSGNGPLITQLNVMRLEPVL
jgi:hypothetical protein